MSKRISVLLACLFSITQCCTSQKNPPKEIFNKDFKWSIIIPENFENVSGEQWAKMQNKGSDAIEATYGEKVINQAKTIFVFKSDQWNYFESNYQPFDPATDGDYLQSCKNVGNILYETFQNQMPNIKLDTARAVEKIDDLEFQVFKMKVAYPNKMILTVLMFSRLFDKKEFTVNIMYVDSTKGKLMIDSWMKSKFKKG